MATILQFLNSKSNRKKSSKPERELTKQEELRLMMFINPAPLEVMKAQFEYLKAQYLYPDKLY